MNTANVMRINAEETNMRELCDSIPLGPMSEYERGFIDGNQTQGEEHMKKPVSPFEWKKNKEPTVFAKDPYFRGCYKTTPVKHLEPNTKANWKI
jgi:hypothetical protein